MCLGKVIGMKCVFCSFRATRCNLLSCEKVFLSNVTQRKGLDERGNPRKEGHRTPRRGKRWQSEVFKILAAHPLRLLCMDELLLLLLGITVLPLLMPFGHHSLIICIHGFRETIEKLSL